ncbi:MAG: aminodeoxychorismate/anthranilate synthase component II [Alphaproteobacteria bacterium]
MIVLIDNYDSFVYNLARYVGELGRERRVLRNDAVTIDELLAIGPDAIIISPGPGTPDQAGVSLDVVRHLGDRIPILGVCLGHQCIGQVHGGLVTRAARPVHGKTARISHGGDGLFAGLPDPLRVGRYHSLIVELPEDGALDVAARADDGEIMALRHRSEPLYGVQFHPESVLTEHGHDLLANFLAAADDWLATRP